MMKKARIPALLFVAIAFCLPQIVSAADGDRILFDHGLHAEQDMSCVDCHSAATTSVDARDHLIPDMSVCSDCHETDEESNCTMCHTAPDLAGETSRVYGAEIFPHATHVAKAIECATCHAAAGSDEPRLPIKADCRSCHETAEAFTDCATCHSGPQRPLPADHVGDWITAHALPAQAGSASCMECHTETGCQECHGGDNVRPRSHGLNFEFSHAVAARANEMECAVCHTEPEYCSSCHMAERVMPRSHSSAGWVNSSDGGRHALDAPFEMEQCIACHDTGNESPSCAACHGG